MVLSAVRGVSAGPCKNVYTLTPQACAHSHLSGGPHSGTAGDGEEAVDGGDFFVSFTESGGPPTCCTYGEEVLEALLPNQQHHRSIQNGCCKYLVNIRGGVDEESKKEPRFQ